MIFSLSASEKGVSTRSPKAFMKPKEVVLYYLSASIPERRRTRFFIENEKVSPALLNARKVKDLLLQVHSVSDSESGPRNVVVLHGVGECNMDRPRVKAVSPEQI